MIIETPLGPMEALFEGSALVELGFVWSANRPRLSMGEATAHPTNALEARAVTQIAEYYSGQRRDFDLELAPKGTPFQLAVWNELTKIPFGETITYAELAHRIGRPAAVRAVGAANGANPIPLIIPCHRVIGSNGTLTGYGGGIERKQWLLAHEGRRLF
jgi:methylated-DNA-[protein]-cysteine S-methyltransferase